jgi:hypothetical protein
MVVMPRQMIPAWLDGLFFVLPGVGDVLRVWLNWMLSNEQEETNRFAA